MLDKISQLQLQKCFRDDSEWLVFFWINIYHYRRGISTMVVVSSSPLWVCSRCMTASVIPRIIKSDNPAPAPSKTYQHKLHEIKMHWSRWKKVSSTRKLDISSSLFLTIGHYNKPTRVRYLKKTIIRFSWNCNRNVLDKDKYYHSTLIY